MTLIDCKNLYMTYENIVAVNNVSFNLKQGDFVSVLGENGSGKSTLIKGILGLKQYSGGSIEFVNLKRDEIGYLPQQNENQKDFPATVTEIVRSGCLNRVGIRPFYLKSEKNKADIEINRLNLNTVSKKSYLELSGGQKQRVLLARAFCAMEKILLLDEPFTGLDAMISNEIYNQILDLNKNREITILMITHDIKKAIEVSNKILHISAEKSFFGTVDEYIETDLYCRICGEK